MNEEKQAIQKWLDQLNQNNEGWVDGDNQQRLLYSADFVHHGIKHAIELKREKGKRLCNADKNVEKMSNRLESYFKTANRKFKRYPGYKTLLLVELSTISLVTEAALSGITSLHFNSDHQLVGSSIRNKKLFDHMNNIGCIVFVSNNKWDTKPVYFDNPFAHNGCKLSLPQASKLLGLEIDFIEINTSQ